MMILIVASTWRFQLFDVHYHSSIRDDTGGRGVY